jgi:hypothetical protein
MNWLSPNFLFAAAAVALPIALHLLRRRVTRVVPFPSLRFLATARPDDRRRQNLRRRVVLALRCLALLALAAAFARPFFGTPEAPNNHATVIVVDNSYSLQAGQRWPDLVRWALTTAGSSRSGDTLGVLLMNPRPTWLVTPTRHTDAAKRALEALKPGWHSTRAEPALRLAGDLLAASPARQRRVIFLGDQQALGWSGADFARPLPAGVKIVWPPLPADKTDRQAAIETLRLRRDGNQFVADVALRNFTANQERTVRIFVNGSTKDSASQVATLAPGAITSLSILLSIPAESIHWIRATIDADDLPADDTAWAEVPATGESDQNFVLLDRDTHDPRSVAADYLGTALQTFDQLTPALRVGPASAPTWPSRAVAVLRSPTSFTGEGARKLDAFLTAGGSTLILMDGSTDQLGWLSRHGVVPKPVGSGPARLSDWTIEHALVAPLAESSLRSLVGWTFARAWSLPADSVDPLASWVDGSPALGEVRIGAGRILLAGFSAERNDGDWPVSPAFVPFLHRAALYLLDLAQPGGTSVTARVGTPLELPAGQAGWQCLEGPASDRPALTVSESITPEAPGLYRWTQGAHTRLYAITLPTDEGDLTPWVEGRPWEKLASTSPEPAVRLAQRSALAAADAEQRSPLWWWCFAGLGLFLLAELPLANRTTR